MSRRGKLLLFLVVCFILAFGLALAIVWTGLVYSLPAWYTATGVLFFAALFCFAPFIYTVYKKGQTPSSLPPPLPTPPPPFVGHAVSLA